MDIEAMVRADRGVGMARSEAFMAGSTEMQLALALIEGVTPETDLRTATLPANASPAMRKLFAKATTFAPYLSGNRVRAFWLWENLGPLADVHVYSNLLAGPGQRQARKAHCAYGCPQSYYFEPAGEMIKVADLAKALATLARCSNCGGFSVQRFSSEQFEFYRSRLAVPAIA